ncbi:sugar ABC transporter substrate-binding protein [Leucobacter sp. CSA1]|uniref:Sugar ABC transporter substrate-binding protein n=1 Tax=Leucobacter chromiisoli TaxID=2796471 RepID=A0A934Q7I8_9MICO|nr:sugar ABC transporter substrate-binding protein [Leucobacter chromiisoli]MBK0419699.1 sugar ABC transporter substrate-binding protein [Leucobacter chromiisoli]
MKSPTRIAALTGAAALALSLAACSPGASQNTSDEGSGTTVTFRLWDDVAAPAYEESFEAFMEQHDDIDVEVEVVPWDDYWERLPLDFQSGDMADIFWTNTSNFGRYVDNGNVINISEEIGDDHDEWVESVTSLYERDGSLWGVPQLWDSIALFTNEDLLAEAGVDPSDLTWSDGSANDTFLEAAKALTTDAEGRHPDDAGFDPGSRQTYGYNGSADLQAIYVNWIAEAGGLFQDENDDFAFASPEGERAFQYLVDTINTWYVAPSAAETNTNGDAARDLFVQGKMGLFQSGPYSLRHIADNADFEWGIAPQIAGPEGRVSVVHGVAALGNADTEHPEATVEVLKWLGSAEGQAPLAEQGVSFPGAVDAQDAFVDYWEAEGVDVSPFIEAANGETTPAPVGPEVNAGANEIVPILQDMFLGGSDVAAKLREAQDAGNAAME